MPRKTISVDSRVSVAKSKLVDKLAQELKAGKDFGQPTVYEQEYATGKVRVTVIWDEWADDSLEDRSSVILKAYEIAEGPHAREKIALASGLTIPEAIAGGMLPYQVISALRKEDSVTIEQARLAFLEQGASTLIAPEAMQLRFATEEEAEACRQRLIQKFPGSEDFWIINRELTAQDFGKGQEWGQNSYR